MWFKEPLESERSFVSPGVSCLALTLLSSILLMAAPGHSVWRQLLILVHTFAATGLALACLPYLPVHFKRTAFFRRPMLIVTGLLLVATLLLLVAGGLALVGLGQTRQMAWLGVSHQWAGIAFFFLLVLHLMDHALRMPARRKSQYPWRFLTVTRPMLHRAGIVCALWLLTSALLEAAFGDRLQAGPVAAAVPNYSQEYGPHPFRPSQTETSHGGFVSPAEIGKSEDCADCHPDIYLQWRSSVHRQAASDPTYVTNIKLLVDKRGIAASRYCEGCHAPVALLTGELSEGGQHGGVAGSMGHREGISCRSCHGIKEIVHLKGVASYRFTPQTPYLFSDSDNSLLRSINHLLVRVDPGHHRADMSSELLSDSRFCAACHAQFMDEELNNWGWVKMQDEYSDWLSSPYSAHEDEFSSAQPRACRDCHMPLVAANDPAAGADGMVRSHYFPGGNTVLPLLEGDTAQLERTRRFLQANTMRVTINQPNRPDSRQDLRALDERIRGSEEAPYYAYLGETVAVDVIISNRGVGHNFPAGTIDLGEAWIEIAVHDGQGALVYQSGELSDDLSLAPGTHVYKSVPVDRGGREVWRHDLFNMVGESFRRVIPAGESDLVVRSFTVPAWARSPLTVSATLKYRKLNERYARFALGAEYQPVPVVDVAWDSLAIPLRIRVEVEKVDTTTSTTES